MNPELWAPDKLVGLSGFTSNSTSYSEFRRSLSKNYLRTKASVITAFASIWMIILVENFILEKSIFLIRVLTVLISITLLSISAHRILLLIHEGAHWQFSSNKKINDFLTNFFLSYFVGTEVSTYRKIHNLHHQNLGTNNDPENSYVEEFDFTWLIVAISGLKTLRTFKKREKSSTKNSQTITMLICIGFHICVGILLVNISILLFLTWVISFFAVLPLIASARNILEHKYLSKSMHEQNKLIGAHLLPSVTTRMFNKSKLSVFYGPVGFSHHLIHHWDPSIPAYQLPKVFNFLVETELGPMLNELPTTYLTALRRLLR